MAAYLLAGEKWTARRLSEASDLLGAAFDAAISNPASDIEHYSEMRDLSIRGAELDRDIDQMACIAGARHSPNVGLHPSVEGGEIEPERLINPLAPEPDKHQTESDNPQR